MLSGFTKILFIDNGPFFHLLFDELLNFVLLVSSLFEIVFKVATVLVYLTNTDFPVIWVEENWR